MCDVYGANRLVGDPKGDLKGDPKGDLKGDPKGDLKCDIKGEDEDKGDLKGKDEDKGDLKGKDEDKGDLKGKDEDKGEWVDFGGGAAIANCQVAPHIVEVFASCADASGDSGVHTARVGAVRVGAVPLGAMPEAGVWSEKVAREAIASLVDQDSFLPAHHYFVQFLDAATGAPFVDGDNVACGSDALQTHVRAEMRLSLAGLRAAMEQPISREQQGVIASCPQHDRNGEANAQWLRYRVGRITGSPTGAICNTNPYSSPTKQLVDFVWNTFRGNAATRWGNEHEDDCEASFACFQNERLIFGAISPVPVPAPARARAATSPIGKSAANADGTVKGDAFHDWNEVLLAGFELTDVRLEHKGLCVCMSRPYLAMSPDGFLVETFSRRTEHATMAAARAELEAAPRSVLSDTPRPVPVAGHISELGQQEEGRGSTAAGVVFVVTLQYVLRTLVEYKCPYGQRNRTTWLGGQDVYKLESITNAPNVRMPVPSYYYTQVQYGCMVLGVLDDLLTWPTHCWVVVWAPAPSSSSFPGSSNSSTSCTSSNDSFDMGSFDDDDAFMQPLRTAPSGGGASLNVQTPHGTIQITRVLFNPDYAARVIHTVTTFWQNRYLPALWQKQNGFLAEGEVPKEDEGYEDLQALAQRRVAKRRRAERESQAVTFDAVASSDDIRTATNVGSSSSTSSSAESGSQAGTTRSFCNEYIFVDDMERIECGDSRQCSSILTQAQLVRRGEVAARDVEADFGEGFVLV